jgi:hypothetical protein
MWPDRLSKAASNNASTIGLVIMLCAIALAGWIVFYVPPNMDEFLPYHSIACSLYDKAVFNQLLEGCNRNLTETLWHVRYFRAYPYVGVFSSVIYYPFFRAWQSPYSHYLLGLVFIFAFYFGLVRLHRLERGWIFALLCFFPFTFQIIHDTGPVRFSLVSFVWVALLTRQLESSSMGRKLLSALLIPCCMALAIEDKPFLALLLPGLLCYALAFCEQAPYRFIASHWRAVLLSTCLFTALLSLIIFQRTGEHLEHFYYQDLLAAGKPYSTLHVLSRFGAYALSPSAYAHRIFEIGPVTLAVSAVSFLLFFWLPLLTRGVSFKGHRTVMLLLSLALMSLAFLHNRAVWAGHHFVFLMVPLLSLFIEKRAAIGDMALKLSLFACGLSCTLALAFSSIQPSSARSRDVAFSYLSQPAVAEADVINFSEWGMYYIQSLYGAAPQLVTTYFLSREGPQTALLDLARTQRRGIINVCFSCDQQSIARAFAGLPVEEIKIDSAPWRVFRISLHHNPSDLPVTVEYPDSPGTRGG